VSQPGRVNELIHDMRNRLTVARANIEAFIDGKLKPTASRLDAVLQSLNQLGELLDSFRAVQAEVDAEVRPVEINVCDLLDHEYRAVDAVASAKGVALNVVRCAVPSEACTHFIGDPVRIGQIISNVLLNAVRYTPSGGSIDVDCSRNSGQLEISIADSGPGIDPQEAKHIFESGFRGSTAGGTPGSGFGLAIAKEFVEAHGGTITASTSARNGARFVVRFPGTAVRNHSASAHCAQCAASRPSDNLQ